MSRIKFKKQEIKLLKYLEKEIIMQEKLMYKKQIFKKYSYNNLEIIAKKFMSWSGMNQVIW